MVEIATASLVAREVRAAVLAVADAKIAIALSRYFTSSPGDYGEGDVFAGVRVPQARLIARQFRRLPLEQIDELLDDEIHEVRLVGLHILVARSRTTPSECAELYLAAVRRGRVNNWDLVDASAEFILGEYFYARSRDVVFELARSGILWERRVAVLTTFGFIKRGDASTTLELAALLLDDPHDLIHKAVGWMLRELGWRVDRALLIGFLDEHAAEMPRTMLSYATEHFSPELRLHYRRARR